jgi:hypothetical protein
MIIQGNTTIMEFSCYQDRNKCQLKLCLLGGRDCFNLFGFSTLKTHRVYKYLEQRTLNLTISLLLLIFTEWTSFLLAVRRKSLISWIYFGRKFILQMIRQKRDRFILDNQLQNTNMVEKRKTNCQ